MHKFIFSNIVFFIALQLPVIHVDPLVTLRIIICCYMTANLQLYFSHPTLILSGDVR